MIELTLMHASASSWDWPAWQAQVMALVFIAFSVFVSVMANRQIAAEKRDGYVRVPMPEYDTLFCDESSVLVRIVSSKNLKCKPT